MPKKEIKFIIPYLDKKEVHTAIFDVKSNSYIVNGDPLLIYSQNRVTQAFQLGNWVAITG